MLTGHEGAVLNVRFNTQGTYCLSCGKVRRRSHVRSGDAAIPPCVLRVRYLPPRALLMGPHAPAVTDVRCEANACAPTHEKQDRTIRLWNPHKGIPIKTYAGHGYEVGACELGAQQTGGAEGLQAAV